LSVGICLTLAQPVAVQPRLAQLAMSQTLREALAISGFDDAIASVDAPNLGRTLTSSAFGSTAGAFVAAYYFEDELAGGALGPLHVSRFDRSSRRWTHGPSSAHDEGGSVLAVQIAGPYVLVEMDASPSAGRALLLNAGDLRVVASVYGFGVHIMRNGSIRFIGSMVHFAPTHQAKLFILDPQTNRTVELFPGAQVSTTADDYRRALRKAYAELPEATRRDYESSDNGPIDDFDRTLTAISERDDGGRVAFVAVYYCGRCGDAFASPVQRTAVQCDQHQSGAWTCDERELEQTSKDLGTPLGRSADGLYSSGAFDTIVQAMLRRP
jgi:hypothetical protein